VGIVLKYKGVWQVLFSAELFRKNTVIFPEISGKIPPEISGNFRTHNPKYDTSMYILISATHQIESIWAGIWCKETPQEETNLTRICAAEMAVRYAALNACRKVHVCHCNSLGGATWRSVTGRTDRRTYRQTDRQSATHYAAPS